jgi:hypothetical protein
MKSGCEPSLGIELINDELIPRINQSRGQFPYADVVERICAGWIGK